MASGNRAMKSGTADKGGLLYLKTKTLCQLWSEKSNGRRDGKDSKQDRDLTHC